MKELIAIHQPYLAQYVKCFVLRTDTHNIYIDAGMKTQAEKLRPYLEEDKHHVLLLTHGHYDHIGACDLMRQYGVQVYASREDLPWLTDFDLHWQVAFGQFHDIFDLQERWELYSHEMVQPVAVDHFVEDGQILTFGDTQLQVIALPGHSAGSVGFYWGEEDTLFTGDALMHTGFFGCLAQYCDYDRYCGAMDTIAALNAKTVYTGHTDPYTDHAATAAAREARAFAAEINDRVNAYVAGHPRDLTLDGAAHFVCASLEKKFSCGACVCVLNHLARLKDPQVERQIDFTKHLCHL